MSVGDSSAAATPEDARTRALGALLHDLRGALTPIGMWVNLALDPAISEEQRVARVRTIEGLVKRMEAFLAKAPAPAEPPDEVPPRDDHALDAVSRVVANAILLMREGGDLTLRAARAGDEVRIFASGAGPELAAAKLIVEAQGGAVRVEEGGAFSFTMPGDPA